MEENKIVIVSDDNDTINFDDVKIKHDSVSRSEVADIENQITQLEIEKAQTITSFDDKIAALKDKLSYAKHIIAIADEERANNPVEDNDESIANDETDDETPTTEIED